VFLLASLNSFLRNSTAHRRTVRMLTILRCSVTTNETIAGSGTDAPSVFLLRKPSVPG
jgi:hypothetical protein